METKTPENAMINCSCATAKGQASRAEPLGPVHVRVRSGDEDCDKKRSVARSCNGSAFSIHSWARDRRRLPALDSIVALNYGANDGVFDLAVMQVHTDFVADLELFG